jgi:hypothetical protein
MRCMELSCGRPATTRLSCLARPGWAALLCDRHLPEVVARLCLAWDDTLQVESLVRRYGRPVISEGQAALMSCPFPPGEDADL